MGVVSVEWVGRRGQGEYQGGFMNGSGRFCNNSCLSWLMGGLR